MNSKQGFTVIIAHYAPQSEYNKYYNVLLKCIKSIKNQKYTDSVEIIVCDDGSFWSQNLQNDENIFEISQDKFKKFNGDDLIHVDRFYRLPDIGKYRGIILKNIAIINAKYDNILILDDDHPLILSTSLQKLGKYLERYIFLRGRIIAPNGKPTFFRSPNAQGTTYAFKKNIYSEIGGFSPFLYENGFGEDNDLLWRMFKYHEEKNIMGGYVGDVFTRDLFSNRWKARSENSVKTVANMNEEIYLRDKSFKEDFIKMHGVDPYNNVSRIKRNWMEHCSIDSFLYEIVFNIISFYFIPVQLYNKLHSVKAKANKNNTTYFKYILRKIIENL